MDKQLSHLIRRWYDDGLRPPPSGDCPSLTLLHGLVLSGTLSADRQAAEGRPGPPPRDPERIQAHVTGCDRCQHLLALIHRQLEDTRAVGGGRPVEAPSAVGPYSPSTRLRWVLPGLAAAACIALVAIISWPTGPVPDGPDYDAVVSADASRMFRESNEDYAMRGDGEPPPLGEDGPAGSIARQTQPAVQTIDRLQGDLLLDLASGYVEIKDGHRLVATARATAATQRLLDDYEAATHVVVAEIIRRRPELSPEDQEAVKRAFGLWLANNYGLAAATANLDGR